MMSVELRLFTEKDFDLYIHFGKKYSYFNNLNNFDCPKWTRQSFLKNGIRYHIQRIVVYHFPILNFYLKKISIS